MPSRSMGAPRVRTPSRTPLAPAITAVAVLWDGGQHLFYPWVLLYGQLFG